MTLGWKAALVYPFDDPGWPRKLFIGGVLMLVCPPVGWATALGYRRAAGLRLRSGTNPPLPEWHRAWWSYFLGGVGAIGVILGYYMPFMLLYAFVAFEPSLRAAAHLPEIALFYTLIVVFPPLFLPALPLLYAYVFPWVHVTSSEMVALVVLFFATAFVLPAAFVQVSVTGTFRTAFRLERVARFIVRHPRMYCEAWILSLMASAIGVFSGPLAPWVLFWSYLVILHAFAEAFLRSGRPDVVAAFAASPLLTRIQRDQASSPARRFPSHVEFPERKAS
jgi:uncharacterized protein DUF4013